MKTHVVAALLVLAGTVLCDPLLACGEKFLMGSRGSRLQRPAPVRTSAAILVYANPGLNLTRALANVPFEATLRKAGYRPTVVSSADAFDTALGQGGWDLVVVDVADSPTVISRAQGLKAPPIVLPVMYNPTGAELSAAKKQHPRILKAPTKNHSFLEAVDDALATASVKAGL
jgi:hypothetical protein